MKLRQLEIVQQTEYITKEDILTGIEQGKNYIDKYAFILHDKDKNENGELKAPHYHILLHFKYTVNTDYVLKWFNIKENYINKIKSQFYNAVLYLTHDNAPEKYQYDENEITSNFNIKEYKQKNEVKKTKKQEQEEVNNIVNDIVNLKIRKNNFNNISPDLYVKYKKSIDNAFIYRNMLLTSNNRNIEIIFITGKTGTGKTTYAKDYAENLINLYDYNGFCISSSSNDPLQDYKDEDILILDDLRDDAFTFTDLLKILDPYTGSSIKSRYNNKLFIGNLIIITSSSPLTDWYKYNTTEDKKQLYRRIKYYVDVDFNNITYYRFNNDYTDLITVYTEENKAINKTKDNEEDLTSNTYLTEQDLLMFNSPYITEEEKINIMTEANEKFINDFINNNNWMNYFKVFNKGDWWKWQDKNKLIIILMI